MDVARGALVAILVPTEQLDRWATGGYGFLRSGSGVLVVITQFSGSHRFLSNFYPSPIEANGVMWPTSEHLYQSCKTKRPDEQEAVRVAFSPAAAKSIAHKFLLRQDWDVMKDEMMLRCLQLKFAAGSPLAARLVATEPHQLIEGNRWHDNYWGNCQCFDCSTVQGENMLGRLLMQVRAELTAHS